MVRVAVSILDADFGCLNDELRKVQNADTLHLDVMDGHFVPAITFGPRLVHDLKAGVPKTVHLMVEHPERCVWDYVRAGASAVIVHLEACEDADALIAELKKNKITVGIALNPETKLQWTNYFINKVDAFLLMAVNPGNSGQSFMYTVLDKITELREMTDREIIVDGGINEQTGRLCALAGADTVVSSSFVFRHKDPRLAVDLLRKAITLPAESEIRRH